MSVGVYTLQLNTGKYYVGKSENIEDRIAQHIAQTDKCAKFIKDNNGVKTQIELLTSVIEDLNLWEQQETLAQMLDKGFNNVRGWEFTNSNPLTYEECVSIKTLLFGSGDLCRKCGNPGHFAQDCKSQKASWFIELGKCMNQKTKPNNIFQNIIKKQENESKITDFELEFAKTNRGKCKKCELNIDKDELKIGIKAVNLKKQEYIKWYHIDCFKKDNNIDMSIVNNFCKKNKSTNQKTEKKQSSLKEKKTKENNNLKVGDKIGIETIKKDKYFGTIKFINKNKLILKSPYYWYPNDKKEIDNNKFLECKGEYNMPLPMAPHKIIDYNHNLSTNYNLGDYIEIKLNSTGQIIRGDITKKNKKEITINLDILNKEGIYPPESLRTILIENKKFIWNVNNDVIDYINILNESLPAFKQKKEKKTIPQQITFHKNCCYRCGNSNHYANNCYATYDVNGNYIDDSEDSSEEVWECSYCGKEFDSEKGALFHENRYCRKKRYY